MSPTIATLRSLSADLYPLPDRLRLIAEIVAADSTAYHDTVGDLLLEWANRLEKAHARLSVLCRTRPVPDDAAEDGEPLAAIAADLCPLPDRLRLMAEIVEGDNSAYLDVVGDSLLEFANRLEKAQGRLDKVDDRLSVRCKEVAHA